MDQDVKTIFSQNLKKIRNQFGWSQEHLAERLVVDKQTVSRWERKTRFPDSEQIDRICKTFQLSPTYFFSAEGELEVTPGKALMVLKDYIECNNSEMLHKQVEELDEWTRKFKARAETAEAELEKLRAELPVAPTERADDQAEEGATKLERVKSGNFAKRRSKSKKSGRQAGNQ